MTEPTAKLTLKVGDKEVEYEADVERVEAQLHRLASEMLQSGEPRELSLSSTAPPPAKRARWTEEPEVGKVVPASGVAAELMAHAQLDRREVARLYFVDRAGQLALRVLPTGRDTRADALMLVLYGMLTLRGRSPLTAPALLKGVRASGLNLPRASRNLKGKSRYVSTSGSRRSMHFRLTPAGIEHCEDLIPGLLLRLDREH